MNGNKPQQITFFSRFEADILSGKKTITIRDQSESHFQPDQVLSVATYEENRFFTHIKVITVSPIHFDDLNERHAQQENMSLAELRQVIRDIYPNEMQFWVIEFEKIAAETLSKSE